jgi:hypothetical protein
MADIRDALKWLAPVDWSEVPLDNLAEYLTETFNAGELLCNSVPPPPQGEPFHSARLHHKTPNAAKSAAEMHPSVARPFPPHQHHAELQEHWGKPMKMHNNPHHVALYKMAGHDRRGAWFARRSVHEGLAFTKFKKAMQREFPHSLTVQGGPGAGAVRGLAADKRLERIIVGGVGELEVFQLSAQMPKPVTPRNFFEMLMTTETGLTEKSAAESPEGRKHVPRHYMIVSRPVEHPDAQQTSSFVRGQYESVELIREIPLHQAQAKARSTPNLLSLSAEEGHRGRARGATIGSADPRGPEVKGEQPDRAASADGEHVSDPELNPVEWIMITRSDPGGGIPRFMVERGTPDAMMGDVTKFLNWACGMEEIPDKDADLDKQPGVTQAEEGQQETEIAIEQPDGVILTVQDDMHEPQSIQKAHTEPLTQHQQHSGILANVTQAIEASLEAYAPASVAEHINNYLHPQQRPEDRYHGKETPLTLHSDSSTSSVDSFMSADEVRRLSTAPEYPDSNEALSIASGASSAEVAAGPGHKRNLSQHEKEVQKVAKEREKLERRLAKKRAEEEEKLRKSQAKDQTEQEKARIKLEKDMKKAEEEHRKKLERLEREAKKAEEKSRKKLEKKEEQNKLSLVSRERDEFRSQLDSYKRENKLLLDRVEELQRENTVMAQRLGKLAGPESLKGITEEADENQKRTVSMRSEESKRSLESKGSGKS